MLAITIGSVLILWWLSKKGGRPRTTPNPQPQQTPPAGNAGAQAPAPTGNGNPPTQWWKKAHKTAWETISGWFSSNYKKSWFVITLCAIIIHVVIAYFTPIGGWWREVLWNPAAIALQVILVVLGLYLPENKKSPFHLKMVRIAIKVVAVVLLLVVWQHSNWSSRLTEWWGNAPKLRVATVPPAPAPTAVEMPCAEGIVADPEVKEKVYEAFKGQVDLLHIIGCYESGFRHWADPEHKQVLVNVDPNNPDKRAIGVMQLLSVHIDVAKKEFGEDFDLYKLEDNIRYAKWLYDRDGIVHWSRSSGRKVTINMRVAPPNGGTPRWSKRFRLPRPGTRDVSIDIKSEKPLFVRLNDQEQYRLEPGATPSGNNVRWFQLASAGEGVAGVTMTYIFK
jgi:hypothetical protein